MIKCYRHLVQPAMLQSLDSDLDIYIKWKFALLIKRAKDRQLEQRTQLKLKIHTVSNKDKATLRSDKMLVLAIQTCKIKVRA